MALNSQPTVAYAIDLLRAHQLRKENTFLHSEVQDVKVELSKLQDAVISLNKRIDTQQEDQNEIRSLLDNGVVQVSLSAEKARDAQLWGKDALERISKLECTFDARGKVQAKTLQKLKDDIRDIRAHATNLASNQRQSDARDDLLHANIRQLIEKKADKFVLEALEARVELLLARNQRQPRDLRSISRVEETQGNVNCEETQIENQNFNARMSTCHLRDLEIVGVNDAGEQNPSMFKVGSEDDKRSPESTVSEDIDLDEHVATPSYALHLRPRRIPSVDLVMLPQPSVMQKESSSDRTLSKQPEQHHQQTFSDQPLTLKDNLNKPKERKDLGILVEGLQYVEDRQCLRQWLNFHGWTWVNFQTFITICSLPNNLEENNYIHSPRQLTNSSPTASKDRLKQSTVMNTKDAAGEFQVFRHGAQTRQKRRTNNLLQDDPVLAQLLQAVCPSMKRKAQGCLEDNEASGNKRQRKTKPHQMSVKSALDNVVYQNQSVFQGEQYDEERLLKFLCQPIPGT